MLRIPFGLLVILTFTEICQAQFYEASRELVIGARPRLLYVTAQGAPMPLVISEGRPRFVRKLNGVWVTDINDTSLNPVVHYKTTSSWAESRPNSEFFMLAGRPNSSTDGGMTWTQRFDIPGPKFYVRGWGTDSQIVIGMNVLGAFPDNRRELLAQYSHDGGASFDTTWRMDLELVDEQIQIRDILTLGFDTVMMLIQRDSYDIGALEGHLPSTSVLRKTTNGGKTWTDDLIEDTTGMSEPNILSLFSRGANEKLYVLGGLLGSTEYSYTTDLGVSWTHIAGNEAGRIYRLLEDGSGNLWKLVGKTVQTNVADLSELWRFQYSADSLFVSTDTGESWKLMPEVIGDAILDIDFGQSGEVFVLSDSTRSTVLTTYKLVTGSVGEERDFLVDVSPNPFSSSLRIRGLAGQNAKVQLYDLLGRQFKLMSPRVEGEWTVFETPQDLAEHRGVMILSIHLDSGVVLQKLIKR